ncbi:MAG: endonuclease/exonuclease/phosphatase family protein [Roseimicrobium sp.]
MKPLVERSLAQLAQILADEVRRRAFIARCLDLLFGALRCVCGLYALFLVCLWAGMGWLGENHLTFAFLLYAPPSVWLLPLVPLTLVSLLDWRSLAICGASVVFALMVFFRPSFHSPDAPATGEKTLTVLSYNRGQSGRTSLQPFMNACHPDVLVLQDSARAALRTLKSPGYERFYYGDDIGEFTILSRFPVKEKELIHEGRRPVAARFELDFDGSPVVIYAVHLMTPREQLQALMRGAFLWGILGPLRTAWAQKRDAYEEFWHGQIAAADTIMKLAESEEVPCMAVGDFNAPATGFIQRRITRKFRDSHEAAGQGFGFTFPGITRNPLSLGGPWMRIDKIASSRQWRPLWSRAELDRASQHRAVAAQFALSR